MKHQFTLIFAGILIFIAGGYLGFQRQPSNSFKGAKLIVSANDDQKARADFLTACPNLRDVFGNMPYYPRHITLMANQTEINGTAPDGTSYTTPGLGSPAEIALTNAMFTKKSWLVAMPVTAPDIVSVILVYEPALLDTPGICGFFFPPAPARIQFFSRSS